MKLILNGLMLCLADFVGIAAGFWVFKLIAKNQLATQIPVAIVVSSVLYVSLCYTLKNSLAKNLYHKPSDMLWIFVAAAIWLPVIFFPLHYVTQGYPSSLGNLWTMLFFQIPTNSFALIIAFNLLNPNSTHINPK